MRVFVSLLVALALVPVGGTSAQTPPPRQVDITFAASSIGVLKEHFHRAPDAALLYRAAAGGVRAALERRGINRPLPAVAAGDEGTAITEYQAAFAEALAANAGQIPELELNYAAVRAIADSLDDSHTYFLTPERYRRWQELRDADTVYGIGVEIRIVGDRAYALFVHPGGTGGRAGVRRFDRVLSIDDRPVAELIRDERLYATLFGRRGTRVSLSLQRAGATQTVQAVRDAVSWPTLSVWEIQNNVGYVRMPAFFENSADEIRRAILDFQNRNVRGVILDLRDNGGGLVRELIDLASLLLPAGAEVYTAERRGRRAATTTRGGALLRATTPMVVLIDEGSASAAETLAASLQDHGRAVVVGTRSAGAANVSTAFPIVGGAALSVTVQLIRTPRGANLEKTGVRPSVEVAMGAAEFDRGVDAQWAAAVTAVTGAAPSR